MPKVMRPSHLRMPFDKSGNLKPDFDINYPDPSAPDINGFPWRRDALTMWSTPAFRQLTLDFIAEFFATNSAWVRRWRVRECRGLPGVRSISQTPTLIVTFTRGSDSREFEASDFFPFNEMSDTETATAKLNAIGASILQQHIDNP